jgi:hypothetical protein
MLKTLSRKPTDNAPVAAAEERPRCGARTRAGGQCQALAVLDASSTHARNGRCRMHGGASSGPKTAEGKARVAEAARARMTALWAAARKAA